MKVTITVKNRTEAEAVRRAMDDPAVRAFVLVSGALLELPSQYARARVLNHVYGMVHDPDYRVEERVLMAIADNKPEPAADEVGDRADPDRVRV